LVFHDGFGFVFVFGAEQVGLFPLERFLIAEAPFERALFLLGGGLLIVNGRLSLQISSQVLGRYLMLKLLVTLLS